jgi:predicted nucleic acid-binding protein
VLVVFVDTSAFFALQAEDDKRHAVATQRFQYLISRKIPLVTTNYVVVEACALLQRRFGMAALHTFLSELAPVVSVVWVNERLHERALATLLAEDRRKLSLVDCVSFELMRDCGLHQAFAFDAHFDEQGFDCEIPISSAN